ncbi:manganese efflux pump MntP family protein [Leptospira sp. 96542]|nr:manganese efflux pump MntP family protein [Leptospira sp. 96542]
MDAFAVSVTEGLVIRNSLHKRATITALFFGLFQTFMPIIGYSIGIRFASMVKNYDHWVAFVLLCIIGGKMLYEACQPSDGKPEDDKGIRYKRLFSLAIATSIDALAIGLSFAFLEVNIINSASMIGITTFILSFLGVYIGFKIGNRLRSFAEVVGGLILIIIGSKILYEHLVVGTVFYGL